MSRIGKLPIPLPPKVEAKVDGNMVSIKGPFGELQREIRPEVELQIESNEIVCIRKGEDRQSGAYHGLYRALINNMVVGVSEKFKKELAVVGVGYKVELKGREIHLQVGYSHPVVFPLPTGVDAEVDPKALTITLTSIDKEMLGQTAANIRKVRPPEPYKGKGIRYKDEHVRQKAGKAGARG